MDFLSAQILEFCRNYKVCKKKKNPTHRRLQLALIFQPDVSSCFLSSRSQRWRVQCTGSVVLWQCPARLDLDGQYQWHAAIRTRFPVDWIRHNERAASARSVLHTTSRVSFPHQGQFLFSRWFDLQLSQSTTTAFCCDLVSIMTAMNWVILITKRLDAFDHRRERALNPPL